MMLQFRFRRLATLAIAASLAAFLVPGLVAAHSELVTAEPAQGAVVPSPFTGPIVLTFSEHLAVGSKADLVGPSGSKIAAAKVDATAKTMTFTLTAPLDPGAYQVQWVSIADDGDLLRQPVVTFTVAVAPTPSAPPSVTPSAAPSTAVPASVPPSAPAASAGPTPVPSGSGTAGGSGDVVLPIIVALIVLGGGAFYLLSRRNRPTDRT
jgi:methionine-rich copper-binding protein CopC